MAAVPTKGLPAAGPAVPKLPPGTQYTFAHEVLDGLGAPATDENVQFLLAWFAREGTKAAFNPLATTLNYGSNTKFNSVGVRNYADEQTGVAATVQTLRGYPGIVGDLKKGNARGAATGHPDEFSRWSGGGYTSIAYGGVGDTIGAASTAGGGTGAGSDSALPPNATPQQLEAYVRDHYPEMAGFLDIPEIRGILIDEAQKKGTAGELEARIYATNWWKTTGPTARAYFASKSVDPANAEQQVQQKMAELAPQFFDSGLSDIDLHSYAENAIVTGMTPDQVNQDIKRRLNAQSALTGLKPGSKPATEADNLAAIARNEYFVPMNQNDTNKWAININAGLQTEAEYRDYLAEMSTSRFPSLKGQGITPGQYMAPIVNTIAQTLDLQPGDINLLDPKWSAVLQEPQADGSTRPMTIAEAQKWARSQPQYLSTKSAMDTASTFAQTLGRTFGAVS